MVPGQESPWIADHGTSRGCEVCALDPGCIAWNLAEGDSDQLGRVVEHPPAVEEGEHLFQVGENLTSVYAVRTGSFKTYAFNSDGHEYVLGFVFAGELLGFDGVYSPRHGCNAVAVEESNVCALPYQDLASLIGGSRTLREQILQLASQGFGDRIVNASLSPEARFANFLLDMFRRNGNGDASEPVKLPMSTYDMASYLRVTAQEIESMFTYLGRKDIIDLKLTGCTFLIRPNLFRSLEKIPNKRINTNA